MRLNFRDPSTQKWMLGIGLAFATAYGYMNFVYYPRRDLAARLTEDIAKESEMLARGKRIAANFQTVQDDYARLMDSWEIAQGLLPTQREMEGLLKSVATEGQHNNVDFLLFKPTDPVEFPYYWAHAIQIKTLSDYHDLGRFLSAVASLDRIVNITDLKMTNFRPNRGRSPNTVEADFVATIYVFKELSSEATASPAGEGAGDASNPNSRG
jgi:type IV pilus assembly protein PilO